MGKRSRRRASAEPPLAAAEPAADAPARRPSGERRPLEITPEWLTTEIELSLRDDPQLEVDADWLQRTLARVEELGYEPHVDVAVGAALEDPRRLEPYAVRGRRRASFPAPGDLEALYTVADALEAAGRTGMDVKHPSDELLLLRVQLAAHRWILLTGRMPTFDEWDDPDAIAVGWPSAEDVEFAIQAAFEELPRVLELRNSVLLDLQAEWEPRHAAAEEDRRRLAAMRRDVERAEAQRREVERRVERATAKADAERDERRAAERALARAEDARRAAEAARDAAEAAARARLQQATETAQAGGGGEAWTEALDEALAEADRLRERLEHAHAREQALLAELDEERRRARGARWQAAAGDHEDDPPGDDSVPAGDGDVWNGLRERLDALPEVESVAGAARAAAERCTHLAFAERAFETASESPYRDPGRILEDLVKLDRLAELYVGGDMGRRLGDVARELNLNWADGATAAEHGRFGRHYRVRHGDREWTIGPHTRTSAGSGAGNTARIYLVVHPGDERTPRCVICAAIGRKLPDSTTTGGR